MKSTWRYRNMKSKSLKIISTIMMSFVGIIALVFLIIYLILPVITYLLVSAHAFLFFFILLGIRSYEHYNPLLGWSIAFLIALSINIFFISNIHMPVSTNIKWRYPQALKYACDYDTSAEFLPWELPDSAHDVHFEFMPTILQGGGHMCVGFKADEEYINDLRNRLESEAKYVVAYRDMQSLSDEIVKENPEYSSGITVFEGTIREDHPDATVYVLYTNYNWNHPHGQAVFISGDYVFFSEE